MSACDGHVVLGYMYINGPSGDLTPSMAIYDTMQSLQSPIGTHYVGYAYNLVGFLLAAGENVILFSFSTTTLYIDGCTGQRFAMPLSRVALESPAGAARGQLLRIRDYLFKELAEKTGQPVEQVHKDLSRIKQFNAQEALDYGLIDRIVRPIRIKADAPRKEAGTCLG
ncbi:putative endopeptidase Clp [Helianthus anomalus]